LFIPGETQDEILISAHACHPSLANDNLSGVAIAVFLAELLLRAQLRYSYRFLFAPGTIGPITWLCRNEHQVSKIRHGLVLACLGDPGALSYKRTRRGETEIDRAAIHVLKHAGASNIRKFSPVGYDERQYCSPGFDLPVGCLSRTPHGAFPEYHTSADNLSFVRPESLGDSWAKLLAIFAVLEENRKYHNASPKCEPQLGRRGLYRTLGGLPDGNQREIAMLWVLNQSDGAHSLLDIAENSDLPFSQIHAAACLLKENGLLSEAGVHQKHGERSQVAPRIASRG
jgi:aminopeptidase-like protein